MLTSCKLTGSPGAVAAYHTKEENYYFAQASGVEELEGDGAAQPHVRIYGQLAQRLGFAPGDTLSQQAFTNLLAGRDAAGNQVTRAHKVNGIDLTFSAPKSVSIGGLLTCRDPRIIEAHDRAVLETMAEIERHCAGTRPRATERVKTGNLAYVTVRDGFNRDLDPHLHTHVVVANMTALGDRVLAVDGRQIMRRDFNKMWGALYRAKLAAHLNELGYSVSYTKKGELRLDAVSLELERAFSGRRAQIQTKKAAGVRDMEAWRRTRKEKDAEVDKGDVRTRWRERAASCPEKTAEQNRADTVREREAWYRSAHWSVEARQELAGERTNDEVGRWQVAARRATDRSACVSAEAIITEYLSELGRAESWESITFAEAEQRLEHQAQAGNLLRTDNGYYTTWDLARADRECVLARTMKVAVALPEAAAAEKLAAYGKAQKEQGRSSLSPAQEAAARGVLACEETTVVVQGDAGAGKTTMLKAVREVAQGAGWDVVGLAVQGVAARKLQEESGIRSTTMAAYLASERAAAKAEQGSARRPARLIALDEASMVDSRSLSELLRCAQERGDKVILVGDRNQIQSVGAGKPFERMVQAAEERGALLSLSENYRQRDPELRQAIGLARSGKMRETIEMLDGLGKVAEIQDAYLRRARVAKEYSSDTLVLTGTRESRDALNELIRERLLKAGEIASDTSRTYSLRWADEDGVKHSEARELAVGDRVTFLENEYKRYDVRNGEVGVVTGTSEAGVAVRLGDGREVSLDLRHYGAIDYGYAVTTYKSQGQTYDRVIVEADMRWAHLQDHRNSYVQITRARDDVKIYTDDREALREAAGVLSVKYDTLDLKVSLSHAAFMERGLCKEALAARAEEEANAKIAIAQARAAADADRLSAAAAQIPVAEAPQPSVVASAALLPNVAAPRPRHEELIGDVPLEGTAELLRLELSATRRGAPREKEIDKRIAEIEKRDRSFIQDVPALLEQPMERRRFILASRCRDMEQRFMLTGEWPGQKVRDAHEAVWGSLPENDALKEIRVHNEPVVADCIWEGMRDLRLARQWAVEVRLRQRPDLDLSEKHRVAEHLAQSQSERVLTEPDLEADLIIAVALVDSGAKEPVAAMAGLSAKQEKTFQRYLDREARATERSNRRELGRGGPSLGLEV